MAAFAEVLCSMKNDARLYISSSTTRSVLQLQHDDIMGPGRATRKPSRTINIQLVDVLLGEVAIYHLLGASPVGGNVVVGGRTRRIVVITRT